MIYYAALKFTNGTMVAALPDMPGLIATTAQVGIGAGRNKLVAELQRQFPYWRDCRSNEVPIAAPTNIDALMAPTSPWNEWMFTQIDLPVQETAVPPGYRMSLTTMQLYQAAAALSLTLEIGFFVKFNYGGPWELEVVPCADKQHLRNEITGATLDEVLEPFIAMMHSELGLV